MPYLAGYVTPQDYGAVGNGVADDTAAIQAAVNAATVGPVYLPAATYLISSAITLPDHAALMGAGSGTYTHATGNTVTTIRLANGSNSSMFIIPAGHSTGRISDIQLDGNKANQTSGGAAILFSSAGSPEESQWKLDRVFVHDAYYSAVQVQSNRQNNKFTSCVMYNCGGYGIDATGTDTSVIACTIGQNSLDGVLAGTVTHVLGCDIFGNRVGVNVPNSARGVEITNCGIDRQQQHGVYVAGSGVNVVACTLHTNGQAANNTYGSITVDDTFGAVDSVSIACCNFWLDAGYTNLPSYHVNLNTSTVTAQVAGCSFQAGSYAQGQISNTTHAVWQGASAAWAQNLQVGSLTALGDNGVGELQVANAASAPTTNPTGGGVLYATAGLPQWRASDGGQYSLVPANRFAPPDHGFAAWAYDPTLTSNSTATVSGTVYLARVVLHNQTTLNKAYISIASAAAGVTANQNFIGLYDSNGTRQAVTAAGAIDAALVSTGILTATFSASYTAPPGYYWVALVNNATTPATLGRASGFTSTPNANLSAAAARWAVNGTSQTSLPATITPSANNVNGNITLWTAVSS